MLGLAEAIERVLAYHAGSREKRRPPGEAGLAMLRELLARDVELRAPLAQRFREEQDELLRLTSEQAALLARSGKTRRMRVTGCAGSGKTMLALEQAAAGARGRTGACCSSASTAPAAAPAGAREGQRHRVLDLPRAVRAPGAQGEGRRCSEYPPGEAPQSYFDDELPTALIDAAAELGPQFDALVVDEAQDLETTG